MGGDPLAPLKSRDHWVEWGREEPPSDKRPYSPTRGHPTGHDSDKSEHWGSYDDCWEKRGFVVTDTPFWGIDIDDAELDEDGLHCLNEECPDCDIDLASKAMLMYGGRSYWETSPSGEGYHMIARWELAEGAFKGEHLEVYTTSRYLTVTEDEHEGLSSGSVQPSNPALILTEVENRRGAGSGPEHEAAIHAVDADDDTVLEALEHVPDDLAYHEWLRVLYALHSWDPSGGGRAVALEWSRQSPKYDGEGGETETQIDYVWDNADPDGEITVATLMFLARQNGWTPPPGAIGPNWGSVLAAFRDDDMSPVTRRDRAFSALTAETEFLAVRDTERLWRYDKSGIFKPDGEQHIGERLEAELGPFFTRNLENEVVNRVRKSSWADRDELGADLLEPLVACENCVVNLQTGETLDHSPEHRLIAQIPVRYDPDAECPEIDGFLHTQLEGDRDRIDTVFEVLACALAPGLPLDNFVIVHGPPGTGKSTLLKLMERFLGEENTASEGLHRLATDNHAMTGMYGIMANLAGDMDGNEVKRTRILLQLSGGDTVTANPKNETPFQFQPTGELVFSTNDLPKFSSNLDAIARRLVTVEMPVRIPMDRYEPMHVVLERLANPGELSGALNKAIEAYQRLLKRNEFTVNLGTTLEERRDEYRLLEDPVERFLEVCTSQDVFAQVPRQRAYEAYQAWRAAVGAKDLDKGQLTARLTERDHIEATRPSANTLGLDPSQGRIRCYKGFRLNEDGDANARAWAERESADGEIGAY